MAAYSGPSEVELEPDIDMIRRHLNWNFEYIYYGSLQIGYNDPITGDLNRFKTFDVEDIDGAADFAAEINSVPGQSCYFRPSAVEDTENKSASDKHFKLSPGAWVDCDSAESAHSIKGKTSALSYNAYTITGRHPYTRVQAFWRLAEGVPNADDLRQWNTILCNLVDGDPAVQNPTTLMRLGGTIAWPYKADRKPELTSFNVKPDHEAPGAIPTPLFVNKLITPYAPVIELTTSANDKLGLLDKGFDLPATLKKISEGIDRHANVVSAAGHMIARNYDDTVTYELLKAKIEDFFEWSEVLERELNAAISSARAKFDPSDLEGNIVKDEPISEVEPLKFLPYEIKGGENIEPRQWIYGQHYIRSFLSATVSPGGIGKSSNALTEMLCCAAGIDYLNKRESLIKPYKVCYVNLEDPMTELASRVEAVCKLFAIDQDTIGDRLLISSGRDQKLVVAKEIDNQVTVVQPIVDSIKAEIKEKGIDVLCIDPFIHSHAVSENSNEAIGAVADIWKEIADECNVSIELIHHTRKLNGQEATAEDARGASGLVGAARSVRAISRVDKAVVERHGIKDDHRSFFFFGDGKSNLAPPPDNNNWRLLQSVDLNNATEEYIYGDAIGVTVSFEPPSAFDGVTTQNLRDVQLAIARGDERIRKSDQTKDWIGYLIAEICELETAEKADKARIRKIIKTWVENEMILETKVKNERRQLVPIYEAGDFAE